MRLRIQTFPPLPDLKAWFSPEVNQTPGSIRELKELLCSNVTVLKLACVSAREIQFFLDDFELLNESSFTASLRDGDLLCVKAQISSPQMPKFEDRVIQELPSQKKRKRAREHDKANKKQRNSREREAAESEGRDSSASSSSDSSSSRSSSPSSSSSSSSSATSSSSGSEGSDSDSSSPPSSQPSKLLNTLQHPCPSQGVVSPTTKAKFASEGPFVPPGYGKPTTHARNLRRKRLRTAQTRQRAESILQQAQSSHMSTHILSQTNATPLGERASIQSFVRGKGKEKSTMIVDEGAGAEEEVEGGQEVMMASLGNKNKKKGYKQFLMAPVPKKIVFTEDGQPVTSSDSTQIPPPITQSSSSQLTIDPSASSKTQKPRPRLVPPSEIQERGELPSNMFVTTVDVEADLWNSNDKKTKTKSRNREKDPSHDYDYKYDYTYDCDYSYVDKNGYQAEEVATLPYGKEEHEGPTGEMNDDAQTATRGTSHTPVFDWSQAEKSFENAVKISQAGDLNIGQIIGWKSLDLNPQTFTPEVLLIAAKVVEYSNGTFVKIQRFVRPIDPYSGFFAPTNDEELGEPAVEVEEYQWADILAGDWRVLQSS